MTDTPIPAYLDPSKPIEVRVDDALGRMTLEEKVAMCHAQSKFSSPGCPRLGIPELWMSDGPHGIRAEICWNSWDYAGWTNDAITAFPALTALAATWNPELAALYGGCLGEEARYRHKDVILGPGVNICRTPLGGRNFEYMGEDPFLAGEMAVPYIKALQEKGVAACMKHFALNNQEKWRGNVNVKLSERALYEIYLPAFRRGVVDGGAWAVMGAYNRIWNEHCCHNDRLLNGILKGEWGFDGCVITDWGGAHSTREAALKGLDIEMGTGTNGLTSEGEFTFDDYYLGRPYLEQLQKGELPVETIDDKARRILRLIFRTAMNPVRPFGSVASERHYEVAKAIADESIVLLKNDGLLPLSPQKYRRVLVVGENAVKRLNEGGGSSELKAKDMFSPLDALGRIYDEVMFAPGYKSGKFAYNYEEQIDEAIQSQLRDEAIRMAKDADAVIYIGGLNKNAFQDCESSDRYSYGLPFGQDELIAGLLAANPCTVIANISGNAFAMPWIASARAVIQSWYLGTMTGPVMADVISGEVNPSGKLPFSIPVRLGDCGAHSFGEEAYPGIEADVVEGNAAADLAGADVNVGRDPQVTYTDDIFVGYRWHDSKGVPALFAFGHGLSYTSFRYGQPVLSADSLCAAGELAVTVDVTNTGTVAGKETVQLYIAEKNPAVLRPAKELKGFRKVSLNPGETAAVTFRITSASLAHYDEDRHCWMASPGKYAAIVASSSDHTEGIVEFSYSE